MVGSIGEGVETDGKTAADAGDEDQDDWHGKHGGIGIHLLFSFCITAALGMIPLYYYHDTRSWED